MTQIIPENALKRQRSLMDTVRSAHSEQTVKPLALVETYGCQQNEADSEKLRGMLRDMGYDFTDSAKAADVIIINTCAIREHAEKRVLGNIGALVHTKKAKPSQIIAVCGCMVQQPQMAEKIRKSFRHVDLVFGPHALWKLPEFMAALLTEQGRIIDIEDGEGAIAEGLPQARDGGVKAWLSVMYGCNNYCTYCIVPYVRGRERSRGPGDILSEAQDILRAGYRDITLLGQNVNSYGKDLGGDADFPNLIRRVGALDWDFRIRFMTSHPKDAGEKLFRAMAETPKAARHIHLPFQAGSSRVLKAMNRGYSREQYLTLVQMARDYMPDIVLTSDVIVGFPGETEAEFEETLSLIEQVEFEALFTFIYSPRGGTPAATLPDPVPKEEKQRWFDRLLDVQNRISANRHAAYIGTRQRVLVDEVSDDPRYDVMGRTDGGRLVRLTGEAAVGSFVDATITGASTWSLTGDL